MTLLQKILKMLFFTLKLGLKSSDGLYWPGL